LAGASENLQRNVKTFQNEIDAASRLWKLYEKEKRKKEIANQKQLESDFKLLNALKVANCSPKRLYQLHLICDQ